MIQISTRLTYTTTIHNNQKKKNFSSHYPLLDSFERAILPNHMSFQKANSPTIPNHKFNKSKRKTLLMREAQKKSILI